MTSPEGSPFGGRFAQAAALRVSREETKPIAADDNPMVAKSSERSGPPRGGIEELIRIVDEARYGKTAPVGSAPGPLTITRSMRTPESTAVFLLFPKRLNGAAREIRTPDPIITNDVLYQLSYCGPADQRRAGGAFRTAPLSMPVFPLLAIRPNAVARAASR